MSSKDIYLHPSLITKEERKVQAGHKSAIIWFTGLSGSGKSTLAHAVEKNYLIKDVVHLFSMGTTCGMAFALIWGFPRRIAKKI